MIYGTFKSINETEYTVQIDCALDYEIDSSKRIQFVYDPIEIEQDVDDTFQHIIKTSANITLLVEDYIGDYIFTANDRQIGVKIFKGNQCIFDGYLQPQSYNQDFAEKYTEITLNCQDYLCTLENHKYRETTDYNILKTEATNRSFRQMLYYIFGTSRNIYYDCSIMSINSSGNEIHYVFDGNGNIQREEDEAYFQQLFHNLGISEMILLGDEEDDLWTQEEVLEEILQYLNLHIVQIGSDFFIFNWDNIRKQQNSITFNCILGNGTTITVPSSTILVTEDMYRGNDTQISMADVYNQIILDCDLKMQDDVLESPLEEESLVSPYTNKNRYLQERKADSSEVHDWYFQYKTNPNWTLRYFHNGYVSEVDEIMTEEQLYDARGAAINQYKIPQTICNYKLAPLLCAMGKVNSSASASDNSIRNNVSLSNYLIITINGSENKNIGDSAVQEWNNITEELEDEGGMMEYKSSTTAGVLSPVDSNTTNYIVFSGKMMMQPPIRIQDVYSTEYDQYGEEYEELVASKEVACNWISATYPNQDGYTNNSITNSLLPYLGYDAFKSKYSEYYGEWFYYRSQSGVDTISKVPLLVCELKIGDKYCVEVSENSFQWLTQAQASQRGLNTTFTLGINPAIGDYLLCKEWSISNTLNASSNVNAEGTAIPIRASDNLSGEIIFRILSPVYSGWEQQIRRHPTMFRSTKWWNTDLPVMEFVQNLYIKDFECKLYTDNGQSNANSDRDLVYMTDIINNSIKTKDDVTFKFNTALSTTECLEKGISTSTKLSNVMYLPDNSVQGKLYNRATNLEAKAEELYIKDYYEEYSTPKLIVESTLDSNSTGYWNHYRFSYFQNKEFYVMGTTVNIKNETTKYKLKQK